MSYVHKHINQVTGIHESEYILHVKIYEWNVNILINHNNITWEEKICTEAKSMKFVKKKQKTNNRSI